MNRQEFTKSERFPLSTQTMALIQDSITAVAELSRIGGANYILSGCTKTGSTIAPGVIVINGEPMPFEGGVEGAKITIIETQENVVANGLSFEKARIKRYAKFATGTSSSYLPWANFPPLSTNQQLEASKATIKYVDDEIKKITANATVPRGVITMWSGETAPEGWALCNGGNETPNLQGKFIVGYHPADRTFGYDHVGNTGGKNDVTLTEKNLPEHVHLSSFTTLDPARVFHHGYVETPGIEMERGPWKPITYEGYTSTAGKNNTEISPVENRPPYYVLAYIMKL